MNNNVIEIKKLTRKFGDVTAVDSIDLNIPKGELFGLIGPNGAGKTTMLKLLTGQLEATSGSSSVLGLDPSKEPMNVKKAIGIVPEIETPPSFLTGIEYLQYIGLIRDIENIDDKVKQWIKYLDMEDVRNVMGKDLSKGTRQKLMIAAAFIHEPKLVFMDEPFIGLDPIYQRKLKEHMHKFIDKGGTIFVCTHILEFAEKMCTRVAIINKGKIITVNTPEGLKKNGETLDQAFMRFTQNVSEDNHL